MLTSISILRVQLYNFQRGCKIFNKNSVILLGSGRNLDPPSNRDYEVYEKMMFDLIKKDGTIADYSIFLENLVTQIYQAQGKNESLVNCFLNNYQQDLHFSIVLSYLSQILEIPDNIFHFHETFIFDALQELPKSPYMLIILFNCSQNHPMIGALLVKERRILAILVSLKQSPSYELSDPIVKDNLILHLLNNLISFISQDEIEECSHLMVLLGKSLDQENVINIELYFQLQDDILHSNNYSIKAPLYTEAFFDPLLELFNQKQEKFQTLFLTFLLTLQQSCHFFKYEGNIQKQLFQLITNEAQNALSFPSSIKISQSIILEILTSHHHYLNDLSLTCMIHNFNFSQNPSVLFSLIQLVLENAIPLDLNIPYPDLMLLILDQLKEIQMTEDQTHLKQMLEILYSLMHVAELRDMELLLQLRTLFEGQQGHELLDYWSFKGNKGVFDITGMIIDDFFNT